MTPFAEPVPSVQGGNQGEYIGHMTRWLSNLSGHKRHHENMDLKMRLLASTRSWNHEAEGSGRHWLGLSIRSSGYWPSPYYLKLKVALPVVTWNLPSGTRGSLSCDRIGRTRLWDKGENGMEEVTFNEIIRTHFLLPPLTRFACLGCSLPLVGLDFGACHGDCSIMSFSSRPGSFWLFLCLCLCLWIRRVLEYCFSWGPSLGTPARVSALSGFAESVRVMCLVLPVCACVQDEIVVSDEGSKRSSQS
jgi:hypothetical protein